MPLDLCYEFSDSNREMAYARVTATDVAIVVFNNDTKPAAVSFDVSMIKPILAAASLTDALGKLGDVRIDNGMVKLTMPARSAAIFTAKK